MNKASSLSLLSNAVLVSNAMRIARIVAQLRAGGHEVDDEDLARSRSCRAPTPCRAAATPSRRDGAERPDSGVGDSLIAARAQEGQPGPRHCVQYATVRFRRVGPSAPSCRRNRHGR